MHGVIDATAQFAKARRVAEAKRRFYKMIEQQRFEHGIDVVTLHANCRCVLQAT